MEENNSNKSGKVSLPVIPIYKEEFDDFETEVTKFTISIPKKFSSC